MGACAQDGSDMTSYPSDSIESEESRFCKSAVSAKSARGDSERPPDDLDNALFRSRSNYTTSKLSSRSIGSNHTALENTDDCTIILPESKWVIPY